jgi:hypothetical protein
MSPQSHPVQHSGVALSAVVAAVVLAAGCLAAAPNATHARVTAGPNPAAAATAAAATVRATSAAIAKQSSGVMHLCHGGTFCVGEPEEPVSRPAPAPYQACARRVAAPPSASERTVQTVVEFNRTMTAQARRRGSESCCYTWRFYCSTD